MGKELSLFPAPMAMEISQIRAYKELATIMGGSLHWRENGSAIWRYRQFLRLKSTWHYRQVTAEKYEALSSMDKDKALSLVNKYEALSPINKIWGVISY